MVERTTFLLARRMGLCESAAFRRLKARFGEPEERIGHTLIWPEEAIAFATEIRHNRELERRKKVERGEDESY